MRDRFEKGWTFINCHSGLHEHIFLILTSMTPRKSERIAMEETFSNFNIHLCVIYILANWSVPFVIKRTLSELNHSRNPAASVKLITHDPAAFTLSHAQSLACVYLYLYLSIFVIETWSPLQARKYICRFLVDSWQVGFNIYLTWMKVLEYSSINLDLNIHLFNHQVKRSN